MSDASSAYYRPVNAQTHYGLFFQENLTALEACIKKNPDLSRMAVWHTALGLRAASRMVDFDAIVAFIRSQPEPIVRWVQQERSEG